jgi:hypothetical protein
VLNCGKDLSIFCPCPKTLWEAEFKGDELILVEEISRQPNIQVIALVFFSYFYSDL